MGEHRIAALALALAMICAVAPRARAGAGGWELSVDSGLALLTYGSARDLQPAVRPLLQPPPAAHCDGCVSAAGEGVAISLARQIDVAVTDQVVLPVRLVADVDASRHPAFGLDVYDATAGPGVGVAVGPLRTHLDVMFGAARVDGAATATAFAFRGDMGVAYRFRGGLELGFDGSFLSLVGDRPAGDALRDLFALRVGYRWR